VIIPNVGSKTLFLIIRARKKPDAVVYSESFQAYDVLDVSELRYMRITHREQFAGRGNPINGIENF
jgi:transposase